MRLIENEEKWGKRKWNDRKGTERNRKKKKKKVTDITKIEN